MHLGNSKVYDSIQLKDWIRVWVRVGCMNSMLSRDWIGICMGESRLYNSMQSRDCMDRDLGGSRLYDSMRVDESYVDCV